MVVARFVDDDVRVFAEFVRSRLGAIRTAKENYYAPLSFLKERERLHEERLPRSIFVFKPLARTVLPFPRIFYDREIVFTNIFRPVSSACDD